MAKIILIVLDGLADKIWPSALALAKKPRIKKFLPQSFAGQIYPLTKKYWPKQGSASVSGLANLGLLGYQIKPEKLKRGVLEAIGSDTEFKNGWLAIRIDFGTVNKNLKVIDRRAGRKTFGLDELAYTIQMMPFEVPFIFRRTYGHRAVLVLQTKLSPAISDSDPFMINRKVRKIKPLKKDKLTQKTAILVQRFLDLAHEILVNHPVNELRKQKGFLPANYLLTREAGNRILKLKPFSQKFSFRNCIAIAEYGAMRGTCKLAGFQALTVPEIHNLNQRWQIISRLLQKAYQKADFIYLHFKEMDEASHDRKPEKKKAIFEKFDRWFGQEFKKYPKAKWVITGDHITNSKTGKHQFGPVPILIYPVKKPNLVKDFNEKEARKTELKPQSLWSEIKHL